MARWKPGASPEFLDPYKAEPVSGLVHLHGQRAGRMVHVGAADAPVTLAQIRDAIGECRNIKQSKLDISGGNGRCLRTAHHFLFFGCGHRVTFLTGPEC